MYQRGTTRVWVETGLALIAAVLTVVSLVRPDWLEAVFGVDPDAHGGALEWAIVCALLVLAIALGGHARSALRVSGRGSSMEGSRRYG
jgi:Na+-driven multidrug efflux pump